MWQFQVFKAYAKKQSGYTIKILRTNKGIEHIIYDDFLKKKKSMVWVLIDYKIHLATKTNCKVERKKKKREQNNDEWGKVYVSFKRITFVF